MTRKNTNATHTQHEILPTYQMKNLLLIVKYNKKTRKQNNKLEIKKRNEKSISLKKNNIKNKFRTSMNKEK